MVERVVDIMRGNLDVEANAVLGEFGDLGLHARDGGPETRVPFSNLSREVAGAPPRGRCGASMRARGLEPPRPGPPAPKAGASTSSATPARAGILRGLAVAVAQLVVAPGCGPGGRGFESHRSPLSRPVARARSSGDRATDFESVCRTFESCRAHRTTRPTPRDRIGVNGRSLGRRPSSRPGSNRTVKTWQPRDIGRRSRPRGGCLAPRWPARSRGRSSSC